MLRLRPAWEDLDPTWITLEAAVANLRLAWRVLRETRPEAIAGKVVYPLADAFFVQWPSAAEGRRRARFVGGLL